MKEQQLRAAVAEYKQIAERDETIRKLRDPVAVHVAMLRGEIAVPPLAELLHVYGTTFSDLDEANIELAKARETIRQLRAGLERLARLYEDDHELCERPMWLQELIARPTRKDGE